MDTSIGEVVLTEVAETGMWAVYINIASGLRQYQEFRHHEEAEARMEQQVAEGQRMVDTNPSTGVEQ